MAAIGPALDRPSPGTAPRRLTKPFDLAATAALLAVSLVVRLGALPRDGLFHDDAWVATAVLRGSVHDLPALATNHPGLTLGLMAWARATGATAERLTWPVMAVAALFAPALYLALRRRYLRPIAVVLGGCAAIGGQHVIFSGRLKSYAIDPLLILILALALAPIDRRRWSWPIGLAWLVSALVIGTFSVFLLVATGVAGLALVVRAREDRRVRASVVGVQAVIQALYLRAVQGTFASGQVAEDWSRLYDGYPTFRPTEPMASLSDLVTHLGRLGQVFPGTSGAMAAILATAAMAGLVIGMVRGRDRLLLGFLGGLVLVAVVGASRSWPS